MNKMVDTYSDYNKYAWFWNKYWGRTSARKVLPVIKSKLVPEIPSRGDVLDVCCGTGHFSALMRKQGFAMSGIDGSEAMIHYARNNCPDGDFVVGDVRIPLPFAKKFHAACSFFDSLNHILDLSELRAIFAHIHHSLHDGGLFLFDLNMEEGYKRRWNNQSFHIINDDHVCIDRMSYDEDDRIGTNLVTLFVKAESWSRMDIVIKERCYSREEIVSSLSEAGFSDIQLWEASAEFGFEDEYGRYYIRCRK